MRSRPGIAKFAVIGVIVAVVVVGALAVVLLGTGGGGNTNTSRSQTSSSAGVPSVDPTAAFQSHIQDIQSRQVTTIVNEYDPSATVVWTGVTAGLGVMYSGSGNIKLLYSGALGTAQTINIQTSNVQVSGPSGSTFSVNATLKISGTSVVLGPYNGTITMKVVYTGSSSGWKISYEHWNYNAFFVTNEAGATTFPEWQKVGEPIATHRSPDRFHNFSWDYGGPGAAFFIWVLAAAVAVAAAAESVRRPG
jgi:hypothetical protein